MVAVLLGSSLKFEGKFILQTRTDGPVDMLVADFSTPGSLRAYARFDADRLEALVGCRRDRAARRCSARGVLALTIDQGEHTQRYQGIVELDGTTLEEAARTYFRQSEQIPTEIRLEVAKLVRPGDGPRALARRRADRAVPARGAGAPAHARPAGRRRRRRQTEIAGRQCLARGAGADRHDRADAN